MALAAAALDECRLPGFHWAMRYLEGVNAVVSCCKQKYVSGIGEGGLSCLFEGPPREIERKAVSNVIIGLLCAELFHIASLFSHEERTSHIQGAGGAVYLQLRRSDLPLTSVSATTIASIFLISLGHNR